jgi:hypothetical protein
MTMSRPVVAIRVLEVDQISPNLAVMTGDVEGLEGDRIVASRQARAAYVVRPASIWPDAVAIPSRVMTVGLPR